MENFESMSIDVLKRKLQEYQKAGRDEVVNKIKKVLKKKEDDKRKEKDEKNKLSRIVEVTGIEDLECQEIQKIMDEIIEKAVADKNKGFGL